MIYIGADHGGFAMKEALKTYLTQELNVDIVDVGAHSLDADDDYPDFAIPVAKKISENPDIDLGILICRSGQGVNIVANKFSRVRAALVWSEAEAKASRQDDMANILALPADNISIEDSKTIVKLWLETPWSHEARHLRRIAKIHDLEEI